MGLFAKNGEKGVEEIVEELLKNKQITPGEQIKFKDASFAGIMDFSVEYLGLVKEKENYSNDVAFYPRVLTRMYEKAPNIFSNSGINATVIRYQHPQKEISSETMTPEDKTEFIETKVEINKFIDGIIRKSISTKQITKDADILGVASTIENPVLREKHQQMGRDRLDAYKFSINKNKESKHLVLVRVFEDGGIQPYAVGPAKLLLDAGVTVHNYERGEKMITSKTAEIIPNCGEKIKRLRTGFGTEIGTLSDKTKIDKKRLEKYESGEQEISYTDAKVLQDYFSKEMGGSPDSASLVIENNHLSMFYREFPSGLPTADTQPTGVQFHKLLNFMSFQNWNHAFNEMDIYTGERERESPLITYDYFKNT
jgi:hypothetical protein